MDLQSMPRTRRALIVEDEITIALDLEDAMSAMGFNHCDLASSDRRARSLAMKTHPDVALVDVSLDGGRKGIEAQSTATQNERVVGLSVPLHDADC